MSLSIACKSCGTKLRVADSVIGRQISCPRCKCRFPVPSAPESTDDIEALAADVFSEWEPPKRKKPWVRCSACGTRLPIAESAIGWNVNCPTCKTPIFMSISDKKADRVPWEAAHKQDEPIDKLPPSEPKPMPVDSQQQATGQSVKERLYGPDLAQQTILGLSYRAYLLLGATIVIAVGCLVLFVSWGDKSTTSARREEPLSGKREEAPRIASGNAEDLLDKPIQLEPSKPFSVEVDEIAVRGKFQEKVRSLSPGWIQVTWQKCEPSKRNFHLWAIFLDETGKKHYNSVNCWGGTGVSVAVYSVYPEKPGHVPWATVLFDRNGNREHLPRLLPDSRTEQDRAITMAYDLLGALKWAAGI